MANDRVEVGGTVRATLMPDIGMVHVRVGTSSRGDNTALCAEDCATLGRRLLDFADQLTARAKERADAENDPRAGGFGPL